MKNKEEFEVPAARSSSNAFNSEMKTIDVKRTGVTLNPDRSRVLVRPFRLTSEQRTINICARVASLSEQEVRALLDEVLSEFNERHQQTRDLFRARFERVKGSLLTNQKLSEERQLLLGAYFTHEYALEAAALFNPSIVPHPDQSNLPAGALRFILSLRATGEGHISSITFRTGISHPDQRIEVLTPTGFLTEPRQIPNPRYEKTLFGRKLSELGLTSEVTQRVMNRLGESFSLEELRGSLEDEVKQYRFSDGMTEEDQDAAQGIWLLARSNYEVQFQPEQALSERVLFPATPSQRNGMEDARFVRFQNEDGTHVYY